MKNISYALVGISSLLIASGVAYYFFSYLPEKTLMSQQRECQTVALERHERDQKDTAENWLLDEPQFVFDAEEKRCLYKTHTSSTIFGFGDPVFTNRYEIWNLSTNNQLVTYSTHLKSTEEQPTFDGDFAGFNEMDMKYFLR